MSVTVRVPATSANLGPGFDALGLALARYDEVTLELLEPAHGGGGGSQADTVTAEVTVEGEGAGEVALDASHLVVRSAVAALRQAGVEGALRLRLSCVNRIPHGRGLGSSAAAVVAGVVAGQALAARRLGSSDSAAAAHPQLVVGREGDGGALALATAFEGHPDNAAPALLGGATVAWLTAAPNDAVLVPRAVRLRVRGDLVAVVAVPTGRLATEQARGLLPAAVPHGDAAFAAGRAALLVHALAEAPELLLEATADTLHQEFRRCAMPASVGLVDALRQRGDAAVVSGAGPTVLVLTTEADAPAVLARTQELAAASPADFAVEVLRPDVTGACVVGQR